MSVGPWQIVIIALVVLLLFGAGRLADIGKGLGEGIKNFKKGISDTDDDGDDEDAPDEPKQLPPKGATDGETAGAKKKKKEA